MEQFAAVCPMCDNTVRLCRELNVFVPVKFRLTLPPALNHWHAGLSASADTFSLTMYIAPATLLSITRDVARHWLGRASASPPNRVCQFWYFCVKVHKNALFHTKYLKNFLGMGRWGTAPSPCSSPLWRGTPAPQTLPLRHLNSAPSAWPWRLRFLVSAPRWLKPPPQ